MKEERENGKSKQTSSESRQEKSEMKQGCKNLWKEIEKRVYHNIRICYVGSAASPSSSLKAAVELQTASQPHAKIFWRPLNAPRSCTGSISSAGSLKVTVSRLLLPHFFRRTRVSFHAQDVVRHVYSPLTTYLVIWCRWSWKPSSMPAWEGVWSRRGAYEASSALSRK